MAQCTAKSKQSGQQCKRHAAPGQHVCVIHGAKAPAARAAAERRLAEQAAVEWVLANVKDAPPLGSLREVYDELLAVAGQAAAWRKVLATRVSELERLGYEGATGDQVRADVTLFERAMDRSLKAGELLARLNLDERRQRMSEQDGQRVANVIRDVLIALDITIDARVGEIIATRLRGLTQE